MCPQASRPAIFPPIFSFHNQLWTPPFPDPPPPPRTLSPKHPPLGSLGVSSVFSLWFPQPQPLVKESTAVPHPGRLVGVFQAGTKSSQGHSLVLQRARSFLSHNPLGGREHRRGVSYFTAEDTPKQATEQGHEVIKRWS